MHWLEVVKVNRRIFKSRPEASRKDNPQPYDNSQSTTKGPWGNPVTYSKSPHQSDPVNILDGFVWMIWGSFVAMAISPLFIQRVCKFGTIVLHHYLWTNSYRPVPPLVLVLCGIGEGLCLLQTPVDGTHLRSRYQGILLSNCDSCWRTAVSFSHSALSISKIKQTGFGSLSNYGRSSLSMFLFSGKKTDWFFCQIVLKAFSKECRQPFPSQPTGIASSILKRTSNRATKTLLWQLFSGGGLTISTNKRLRR